MSTSDLFDASQLQLSHLATGCQQIGASTFPFIIQSHSTESQLEDVITWSTAQQDTLKQLASEHGAVLLRDFPFAAVEDFDAWIRSLQIENFPYKKSLSNAVRINRTERVFSANEAPPEVTIYFHHEMAQTPIYPQWIMFYCEIPAETGGATPLCRSDLLYDRLQQACPEFIQKCEATGLKYTNIMPAIDDPNSGMGRSWRSTLGIDTKEQAEQRLSEIKYSWEWLDDDCLKATTPAYPAVMEVAPGRRTFFNQLIAAYSGWSDDRNDPSKAIRHGDGTILDAASVQTAIDISEEIAFDVAWQTGDAVLIDNRIVMHARRTFSGTRKIVASLGDMQHNAFESLEPVPV